RSHASDPYSPCRAWPSCLRRASLSSATGWQHHCRRERRTADGSSRCRIGLCPSDNRENDGLEHALASGLGAISDSPAQPKKRPTSRNRYRASTHTIEEVNSREVDNGDQVERH